MTVKRTGIFLIAITIIIFCISITSCNSTKEQDKIRAENIQTENVVWRGANKYQIPSYNDSGKLILYGYELIANTSYYLGPSGTVAQITNGMNCQNCHLDGGTVPFGNNFGKVYATYPKYRSRNNGVQSIYVRINDCLERSLNGKTLDSSTREMKAIYAYFKWLGEDVPKGTTPAGTSIPKLKYLDRPADANAGEKVYIANCQTCHGQNGQGQLNAEKTGYTYPPLWGEHSYNDGAGLYRIGSFAAFVKNNMPFGTDYQNPKLTDEEAWDIAAFVNSKPRPHKDQSMDWHDVTKKPIDYPYGPYVDTFSEKQHKYGPFQPIADVQKAK
ncbi:MAG: c-type cytochrome [Ilyomonas sp.]